MSRTNAQDGVAVVIPSHNYGHFLADAVDSALAQLTQPAEVVIVDDASTDNTADVAARYASRGVRYIRVEHSDVQLTRRAGLLATTAPLLCFLDADDTLPPDYLQAAAAALAGAPTAAIAYTDLRLFGACDAHVALPPNPRTVDITRANHIHAGSVVRRCAIDAVGGLEPPVALQHADWLLWRRIIAGGWHTVKADGVYNYRKHGPSLLSRMEDQNAGYFVSADLAQVTVDIVIPFSGRLRWWPRLRDWLKQQTWPHAQCRLIAINTAQSPLFAHSLRTWLASCDYSSVQYEQLATGAEGLADKWRGDAAVANAVRVAMVRIYAAAQRLVSAPYTLVVEDDILPPANAIEQLLRCVDENTASVSGAYRSRDYAEWVVRTAGDPRGEPRGAVEPVSFSGFGCLLMRTSAFKSVAFRGGNGAGDYDVNFYDDLFAQGRNWDAKVNWNVRCVHADTPATSDAPTVVSVRRECPPQVPPSRMHVVPPCASDTRLAVLTTVFGSKTRQRENYHQFMAGIADAGVPAYVIECAIGDADFWVPDRPGLVRVRAPHVGWHKERLLNILERVVPPRFTKLAWIDADIMFDDPAWAGNAETMLDHHPVLQLFDTAVWLRPDSVTTGVVWPGFVATFLRTRGAVSVADSHPGFAWAMRRDLWRQQGGLWDRVATGWSDVLMAYAWCGQDLPSAYDNFTEPSELRPQWVSRARRLVASRLGAVPGRIRHLWHGPYNWRQYGLLWPRLAAAGWCGDAELVQDAKHPLQLPYRLARPDVFEPVFTDYFMQRGDDLNIVQDGW